MTRNRQRCMFPPLGAHTPASRILRISSFGTGSTRRSFLGFCARAALLNNVVFQERFAFAPTDDSVSRANIVRAVGATKGAPLREGEGDDRSIRASLLAELGREEWARVWPEDIIVRDGIVHFWISEDEPTEKRQALRVAAETIPGVRGIEEHVLLAPLVPAF